MNELGQTNALGHFFISLIEERTGFINSYIRAILAIWKTRKKMKSGITISSAGGAHDWYLGSTKYFGE